MLPERSGCTRFALGRTADGSFVADMQCNVPPSVTRGRATYKGDYGKHFVGTIWTDWDKSDLQEWVDVYDHLGPCPPGVKPRNW